MFWKKDKSSEPVNPELAREVNRKKSNSNFMIITIIFFAGLFIVITLCSRVCRLNTM